MRHATFATSTAKSNCAYIYAKFLGLLQKFGKAIVLALAAGVAAIRKLLFGRGKDAPASA